MVRYTNTKDHVKYIGILEANLLSNYPLLRGTATRHGALIFQQDNAPAHRDHNTKQWLKDHRVYTLDFPPYCPDLNPIENLWGILQDKLYHKNDQLHNAEDVWEEFKHIWYNDLNMYVHNLYESMPFRFEEVIERDGYRLDH